MVVAIVDNQLVQAVQYGMHVQVQVFLFIMDVVCDSREFLDLIKPII